MLGSLDLGPNPGPTAYSELKSRLRLNGPSGRELQEMMGSRYGLTKQRSCSQILDILNARAREIRISEFNGGEVVSFDSIIPDFGRIMAELTARHGTNATPLNDIATASGYSVAVVESALQKRLLPHAVCTQIATAAHSCFAVKVLEPLRLPEHDQRHRPPAVEDGRYEIILRLGQ
jgi:hypothetical protein